MGIFDAYTNLWENYLNIYNDPGNAYLNTSDPARLGSIPRLRINSPGGSAPEFNLPELSQADALPAVFGRCRVQPLYIWAPSTPPVQGFGTTPSGLNLRWNYTIDGDPLRTRGAQVTKSYRGSALLAICDGADELREVWREDVRIWEGAVNTNAGIAEMRLGIPADNFPTPAGNDKVFFYRGDHLFLTAAATGPIVPLSQVGILYQTRTQRDENDDANKYRGTSLLYLDDVFLGDNVRTYPRFDVVVARYDLSGLGVDLDPTYRRIGDDANPAHVAYALLVHYAKVPLDLIHKPDFEAAAATLHAEGLGISVAITDREGLDALIERLETHIDAKLFADPATGRIRMQLIRDDYNVNTLQVVTPDELAGAQLVSPGWDGTLTSYRLVYTDPASGYRPLAAMIRNPATAIVVDQRKDTNVDLQWFTTRAAVEAANDRAARRYFYPLRGLNARCHRQEFDPQPNGLFVYTDPRLNISGLVMRIGEVQRVGDGDDEVTFSAVEDIYSIGSGFAPAIPPPGYSPVDLTLEDAPDEVVALDALLPMAGLRAALFLVAPPPTGSAAVARVLIDGAPVGVVQLAPVGTLDGSLAADTAPIIASIAIENCGPGWPESAVYTSEQWQRGAALILIERPAGDYELASVQNITGTGATRVLGRVIRGLGCDQLAHADGARVWLVRLYSPPPGAPIPPEDDPLAAIGAGHALNIGGYTSGTVTAAAAAYNLAAVSPESAGSSYTYGFTAETPRAPTNLNYVGGMVHRLFWSANTRTAFVGGEPAGAMPFDADEIVAGISGTWDGVFRIYKDGVLAGTTFDRDWEVPSPRNGDYVVRHEVAGFLSPPSNTVTIP